MAKKRTKKARRAAALKGWDTRRRKERERAALERKLKRQRRDVIARRKKAKRVGGGVVMPPPPPKPPKPPKRPDDDDVPEYDEPLDDLPSDEWEIGFEYRGGDKGGFVDVNIRIAREDGEAFGEREASRVLRDFRETLINTGHPEIPAGYMMAFIDWHRPRWGTVWQSGDDVDLTSFRNPMMASWDDDNAWSIDRATNVRLGSVKK